MSKLYVVSWPNGTVSILTAATPLDLFRKLDSEGDPTDKNVKIKQLNVNEDEDFHLTTALSVDSNNDNRIAITVDTDSNDGEELVDYKLPKNIFHQYWNSLGAKV